MNVIDAITQRRSIRKYQSKNISNKIITELLDAARLAPSGNNAQPSRYKVITDSKTKKILKEKKIFVQEFVYTSPVIIVCCADPNAYKKNVETFDNSNEIRAIRDLSIATAFLMLRAEELGLGTCYVGWMDKEKIKIALNIPEHFIIPYVITIGYPNEKPKNRSRKKINEICI